MYATARVAAIMENAVERAHVCKTESGGIF